MTGQREGVTATRVSPKRLRAFFHPQRIALVGATDKSRWSQFTYANLQRFGGGAGVVVDCVHPSHPVVHGQVAVPTLADIDGQVDLAYVMVSTERVLDVLREAHDSNIHHVVILTSGFSEVGGAGAALEQALLDFARAHDQVLLGPNGNGFINASAQFAPYGLPITPPLVAGPVGIVLQSGALASTVLTLAQTRGVGVSLLVSMGNEAMMSATDVMDYLIEDDQTQVLAVFLESIRQPDEFARVATKALQRGKPIVAMKIGRSAHSARSALAHTGALVGDDKVNDAALRQLGVMRVHSLEDLITTAGLLGYGPPLCGRKMGVITPSGGACDILCDRAADEGIELPDFTPETAAQLREIVPTFSTVHNPLDVTGFVVVDSTLLRRALACAASDANFDFLVCLADPPRMEPPDVVPVMAQWRALRSIIDSAEKPVLVMSNSSIDITPFGRLTLERSGVHVVGGMEHGMSAIGCAVWWQEQYRRRGGVGGVRVAAADAVGDTQVLARGGSQTLPAGDCSELAARQYLAQWGVPVVPGQLVMTPDEAAAAAEQIGFPVALKVQSPDILHKSDIGGVALGLRSGSEVRAALDTMLSTVRTRAPHSRVDGVLVSPMRSAGTELLVGVVQDALWGPVLAVGLGGVFVEVLQDTALRLLPVGREDITEMLQELRGYPLLRGIRGQAVTHLDRVADVIERIAQAALALGHRLQAVEVNPLWVRADEVEALDALVSLRPPEPGFVEGGQTRPAGTPDYRQKGR